MGGKARSVSLKYVHLPKARGKQYAYYRRSGQSIRIKGELMSYEFISSYNDIHATFERPDKAPNALGTFGKLIEDYKSSPYFKKLADKTRKEYLRYIGMIEVGMGDMPVARLETPQIYKIRDKMSETPRKADFLVSVLSALLTYSMKQGYRNDNPARVVDKLSDPEGHRPWEDYEVAAFRKHWAADTVERVAFELMLNTGQRGGDVIDMTLADYRNGTIKIIQNKTGEKLEIDASNALRAVLDPWTEKHKQILLITNNNREQFKKRNFESVMRKAYTACSFDLDITSHGLRYTAASILHEYGLDWETIGSITGHRTRVMVEKYTRKKRLSAKAIREMNKNEKSTKV